MIPLNVKSPLVHEISAIPITSADATMIKLLELEKSTFDSIQIRAPSTPIIPNSATPAPPSAPVGVALSTAPNLGESDSNTAPTPAIQ